MRAAELILRNFVIRDSYFDSATLMLVTNRIAERIGSDNVAVMMGSATNKDLMRDAGLLSDEGESALPNDLLFAAKGEDKDFLDELLAEARVQLFDRTKIRSGSTSGSGPGEHTSVTTVGQAVERMPGLNLALVSVPGTYAAYEARKALDRGLHVLLFSDNVSIEDEVSLKKMAVRKGLLMMGPDCGSAIINGIPLAFANVVRRGKIGVVAAAGTGLQEVTSLIDQGGGGITQAIGTGGRDVKDDVGAMMMLSGIDALAEDRSTEVIVVVSKPPGANSLKLILERLSALRKPVVTCFLGEDRSSGPAGESQDGGRVCAETLEDAARFALALQRGENPPQIPRTAPSTPLSQSPGPEGADHGYLRGLYTGGTLCYESLLIARRRLGVVYSNTPVTPGEALDRADMPVKHTILDLGDDFFTRGRPHPMIDPSVRNRFIETQGADPTVRVILLDLVIGYGAHGDPAGNISPVIESALQRARSESRSLAFVASVCGTDADPQGLTRQRDELKRAGVHVFGSNAEAARAAVEMISGGRR